MTQTEINQAQKLINNLSKNDTKCLKEIYGNQWKHVANPKDFGKKFKKAVENDEDYILRWPVTYNCNELLEKEMDCPYNTLVNIKVDGDITCYAKKIKAKELILKDSTILPIGRNFKKSI